MKVSKLAYKNFKGNFYRYAMFALSNSFAVTAFFIFANFIFHPSLDFNDLGGHYVAAMGAKSGMVMSQIIIVMFSFLFVGYSTSVFLKSRGKEFGLLSLYGMTMKQIRRYIAKENTMLSLFSIVTGSLVGIVFSKLFLMIMENLLAIDLAFNISLKALGLTFVVFFILFEVSSYIMLFSLRGKEIAEQMKSSRIPKELPKFSKSKAILGLVLLLLAYGVAWIVDGVMVPLAMIPVTTVTIVASYFLFTQFSIYMADKLKRSKKVIYNKINLISYSQIIFKLKDTAKVMFLAAIFSAVAFTATETIVSFYTEIGRVTGFDSYEDLGVSRRDAHLEDEKLLKEIEAKLKDEDIDIVLKENIRIGMVENLNPDENNRVGKNPGIIAQSEYNKAKIGKGQEAFNLKEGQAQYIHIDAMYDPNKLVGDIEYKYPVDSTSLKSANEKIDLSLEREIYNGEISIGRAGYAEVFVLNDKDFERLYKDIKDENKSNYTIYKFTLYKRSDRVGKDIYEDFLEKGLDDVYIYPKESLLKETKNQFATILFIAFFIAFLFFISSGSMIYFKLFNEIEQDKLEYSILEKIGMDPRDIKKIITKQIGILFFLPFLVGVLHSLFALKSLSNLLRMNLIRNGLLVSFAFLIFQIIYFFIIRNIYMKKLENY